MVLPKFSTLTSARFEAHGRNAQKSIGPPAARKGSFKDELLITLGLLPRGSCRFASLPYFRKDSAEPQNWVAPVPNAGRPYSRQRIFFVGLKAGMLLKTHESRTKYTNFERLFSARMRGFCTLRNESIGFCKVRGES